MKMVLASLLVAASFAQALSAPINGCSSEAGQAAIDVARKLGFVSVAPRTRTMVTPVRVENGVNYFNSYNMYDSEGNTTRDASIIVTTFRDDATGTCAVVDVKN